MIIFKSHSTHFPTREKVTTSNHNNLTGNLCEKHVTQLGIKPRTFGLTCKGSTPELSDHTDGHVIHTNCPWQNLYLAISPGGRTRFCSTFTFKYLEDILYVANGTINQLSRKLCSEFRIISLNNLEPIGQGHSKMENVCR